MGDCEHPQEDRRIDYNQVGVYFCRRCNEHVSFTETDADRVKRETWLYRHKAHTPK